MENFTPAIGMNPIYGFKLHGEVYKGHNYRTTTEMSFILFILNLGPIKENENKCIPIYTKTKT